MHKLIACKCLCATHDAGDHTIVQVWGGTRVLLDFLSSADSDIMEGCAVIELGAGLGLVGICAAVRGCHVLLTDVATVTNLIQENILTNAQPQQIGNVSVTVADQEPVQTGTSSGGVPWLHSHRIGSGSAACMPLNWLGDIQMQASHSGQDLSQVDYIIACEVIWLQDLLQAYVQTLSALLHSANQPVCYMSYTIRGTESSRVFTAEVNVKKALQDAGCSVTVLPEFSSQTCDGEGVVFWKIVANA